MAQDRLSGVFESVAYRSVGFKDVFNGMRFGFTYELDRIASGFRNLCHGRIYRVEDERAQLRDYYAHQMLENMARKQGNAAFADHLKKYREEKFKDIKMSDPNYYGTPRHFEDMADAEMMADEMAKGYNKACDGVSVKDDRSFYNGWHPSEIKGFFRAHDFGCGAQNKLDIDPSKRQFVGHYSDWKKEMNANSPFMSL